MENKLKSCDYLEVKKKYGRYTRIGQAPALFLKLKSKVL